MPPANELVVIDSPSPAAASPAPLPLVPVNLDLASDDEVAEFLRQILPATRGAKSAAAAILPWVFDRLPSEHSRRAYSRDLAAFVRHMEAQGIDPLQVTGDDVRMYREALKQPGKSRTTIARVLSVLRGTYEQLGKKGLMPWDQVRDIQAVESPRVEKNTTPCLSQKEAVKLLHSPDTDSLVGQRDHALLFCFFKTPARCSALAKACVGHLERTDTDYYLWVTEKGGKTQRKALLEAALALLEYLPAENIRDDVEGPLFRAIAKDRKTLVRKYLTRSTILTIVKKYARKAGIATSRLGARGMGVHSLRKTAITNALQNGAPMEKVQQLAGHCDIRTTQLYFQPSAKDAEDAAGISRFAEAPHPKSKHRQLPSTISHFPNARFFSHRLFFL